MFFGLKTLPLFKVNLKMLFVLQYVMCFSVTSSNLSTRLTCPPIPQGPVQQQPDGAAGEPARVSLPPPAGPVSYTYSLKTYFV